MAGLLLPSDYINGTNPLWWGMSYIRRKRDGHIVLAACPNTINNPPITAPAASVSPFTNRNHGRLWVSVWDDNTPSNAVTPQELESDNCFAPSIGERSDGTLDIFYSKSGDLYHTFSRDGGKTWSIGALITPPNLSVVGGSSSVNQPIQHCYYGKSGLLVLTMLATSSGPLPAGNHWLVIGQINTTTQRWVLTNPPVHLVPEGIIPGFVICNLQYTRDGKVYCHGCDFKFDNISSNGTASLIQTNSGSGGNTIWAGTFRGVFAGGGIDDGAHNNNSLPGWVDEPGGLLIKTTQVQNDSVASRDGWHTYLKGSDGIWEEQALPSGFGGPQGTIDKWRLHYINGSGFDTYILNNYGSIKSRPDGRWEWMFPFPPNGEINFKLSRDMHKSPGTVWT